MLPSKNAKTQGQIGEIIAANYLRNIGYNILETNFENTTGYRLGEIDIIAEDPSINEIIFVEVKTRRKRPSQSQIPEAAIDQSKYHKLRRIIDFYLRKNALENHNFRLDAISIELDIDTHKADLRHLQHIYF